MLPDKVREKWRGLISRGFGGVQYAYLGENTVIRKPIKVEGAERIHIGADCLIEKSVHLEVLPPSDDSYTPRLRIGDRVQIGPGVKIICQGSIVIEDDVEIEKTARLPMYPKRVRWSIQARNPGCSWEKAPRSRPILLCMKMFRASALLGLAGSSDIALQYSQQAKDLISLSVRHQA